MDMTHSAMPSCIDMDSVRNTQTCRTCFIDIAELEFGGAWARSVSMNASERMYKWSLIVQLTVLLRYGIRYTQIRTKIHACTNRSIPVHYEIRSNDSTYDIYIYTRSHIRVIYISKVSLIHYRQSLAVRCRRDSYEWTAVHVRPRGASALAQILSRAL